ncbi:hypothetical protein D3C80_1741180 [compost metagenome]
MLEFYRAGEDQIGLQFQQGFQIGVIDIVDYLDSGQSLAVQVTRRSGLATAVDRADRGDAQGQGSIQIQFAEGDHPLRRAWHSHGVAEGVFDLAGVGHDGRA